MSLKWNPEYFVRFEKKWYFGKSSGISSNNPIEFGWCVFGSAGYFSSNEYNKKYYNPKKDKKKELNTLTIFFWNDMELRWLVKRDKYKV